MSIRSDEKYRPLLSELVKLPELCEQHKFDEAREAALKLKASCAAAGIRSAQVLWNLAIAADCCGDYDLAFESIREALALDPISPQVWQSFRIIIERMQRTLADETRAAGDEVTPKLYALLIAADETTPACHVAMARWLRHANRIDEALSLLEAVTRLHPTFAPAWRELAGLARATDRAEIAQRAEVEATALGDGAPVPFWPAARAQA